MIICLYIVNVRFKGMKILLKEKKNMNFHLELFQ